MPGTDLVSKDPSIDEKDRVDDKENVKVMVRCRPVLASELKLEGQDAGWLGLSERGVEIADRQFHFDQVFSPNDNNEQVYIRSLRQLVESAFAGFNCTVFLYGQTGTGKTYTHSSLTSSAFAHLFSLVQRSNKETRILIRASYYELYNEEIRDLLAPNNKSRVALELRESKARGVYVKDLSCYLVNNLKELERLKSLGDKQRATASTKMNQHSSRSHSILTITIETVDGQEADADLKDRRSTSIKTRGAGASGAIRLGRLNLIDLAGSERQSKSGSSGTQLREAARINLSLTCLALVIRALTDPTSSHVPYRNSKLTRILSSSLGGNSRTLLIACISPVKSSAEETLNTLRFASRTKLIKNEAKINEDPKDALLRKYRRQIEELRLKLQIQVERKLSQKQRDQLDATNSIGENRRLSEAEAIEAFAASQGRAEGDQPVSKGTQADSSGSNQDSELVSQLRLLRAKIMVGGVNLLEKAEVHERLLEASKLELEEKAREEEELRRQLQLRQHKIQQIAQSKGSLEEQLAELDEKLSKVLMVYKQTKEEHRDSGGEHNQLKESLLQSIRATSKEIKFADCIIEDFIPREFLELLNNQAYYDEHCDEWQIKYVALSGNNAAGQRLGNALAIPIATSAGSGHHPNQKQQQLAKGVQVQANKSNKSLAGEGHFSEAFIKLRDLIRQ